MNAHAPPSPPAAAPPREPAGERVLYICDWLPPDFGAVGQYSLQFAREMAQAGAQVTLAGLSSQGKSDETMAAGAGRLRVIKLAARPYAKSKMLRRLIWTAAINTRLLIALWAQMRWADRIIFTGSPPLFLHWIAPANLLLRKHLVYRITDFHPECSIAERGSPSVLLQALRALTIFWRRRVSQFEALGHDQARRLAEIGIPAERITLKADPSPVTINPETPPLLRPPGAEGKILLLYSGNWGVAHDHSTFVEAYRRHYASGPGKVFLWLNAVGGRAKEVESALTNLRLPFAKGAPVPIDQLASLLVTPDAHLITLSDPFVGYVLPSKVHGCVQSGKGVIFIGSASSDVHRICCESGNPNYRRIDTGRVEDLVRLFDEIETMLPVGAHGSSHNEHELPKEIRT